MPKPGYIHGYSNWEQERLLQQARVLEEAVFLDLAYPKKKKLLELGCGVGAQTGLLLQRFPKLKITGIDHAAQPVEAARQRLKAEIKKGRLKLEVCDAAALPFPDGHFDAAFACWFFEHTPRPSKILIELLRVLKPGGIFHDCEVDNGSFQLRPMGPAYRDYWQAYNALQKKLGGDPNRGLKMKALLKKTGFSKVESRPAPVFCDNRRPLRLKAQLEYWRDLMLSALPALLEHKMVDQALADKAMAELMDVLNAEDGMFLFKPVRITAVM